MGKLSPAKRSDLLRRLKRLGFKGPYSGGKHQFLERGSLKLIVPNPHRRDIGPALLAELLDQAGLTREEWEETA